jgi:hypothetical protein
VCKRAARPESIVWMVCYDIIVRRGLLLAMSVTAVVSLTAPNSVHQLVPLGAQHAAVHSRRKRALGAADLDANPAPPEQRGCAFSSGELHVQSLICLDSSTLCTSSSLSKRRRARVATRPPLSDGERDVWAYVHDRRRVLDQSRQHQSLLVVVLFFIFY